jgi:hypothetical protein
MGRVVTGVAVDVSKRYRMCVSADFSVRFIGQVIFFSPSR